MIVTQVTLESLSSPKLLTSLRRDNAVKIASDSMVGLIYH